MLGLAVIGHAEVSGAVSPTRYIPLRFIQLMECDPPWQCTPPVSTDTMRAAVDRANVVFAPAGLKFWVWSNELHNSPSFEVNSASPSTWNQVRSDLKALYPTIPDQAWEDSLSKPSNNWLDAGGVFYSDPNFVQVYVHQVGAGSSSLYPWSGRGVQISAESLEAVASAYDSTLVVTTHLAHELGHYFGVTHPWGTGNWYPADRIDPTTCVAPVVADDWDLLRCADTFPGPSRTFTSRADWESYGCSEYDTRWLEQSQGSNCNTQPSWVGKLWCDYGAGNLIDATTTGLAFEDVNVVHNPPASFRYGLNLMAYYWDSETDRRAPAFLSDTQLETLDKWLTSDCWDVLNVTPFLRDDGSWPTEANWWGSNAARHAAGATNARTLWSSNSHIGMDFTFEGTAVDAAGAWNDVVAGDFDGDGAHDLLYFSSGQTTVRILWGAGTSQDFPNFFYSPASFTKVFVGDFNGNGVDDVFVYGAGALLDYMKFGNWNRTFTTYSSSVSGTFTPFVGNFDAAYGDDIFWYSPSGGYVNRWYSTASATFYALNYFSVPAGGPFTPVVGNFDAQLGDDVFWYKPGSGQDKLWYSIGSQSGFTTVNATNVYGTNYYPVSGDFDGDGYADIYWYEVGNDSIWPGRTQGTQFGSAVRTQSMHFSRVPIVGDFDGNYHDDLYWK